MSDPLDNPFPQNLQAEQFILGAVILDNGVAPQALHELSADDFFSEAHRRVFRAMRELESRNEAINPLTLQEEMRKLESLDAVGGPAFLASLFDGVPRFSDIRDYVRLVKEASLKRKAINTARWLSNEAFAPDTRVDELLASLREKIADLEDGRIVDDLISTDDAVTRTMAALEESWESGRVVRGLSTGFPDLDKTLLGLQGGKYYVLAAGTGIGKTALALSIANSIIEAEPEKAGLIISLEMPVDELVRRRLANATRIDSYSIETGALNDAEKNYVREKAEALRRVTIDYVEGFSKITASSIASRVQRVKRKYGRVDFLVIDYLQLLDSDNRSENENARLTEISRAIKRITLNFNIPVIVLSQLSRQHATRANKDYVLSDLRGSGSIEQDADVVLFLMPENWDDVEAPGRRLVVGKHRGGKPHVTIPLVFFGSQYRFESGTRGDEGDPFAHEAAPYDYSQNGNGNGAGKKLTKKERIKAAEDDYYSYM